MNDNQKLTNIQQQMKEDIGKFIKPLKHKKTTVPKFFNIIITLLIAIYIPIDTYKTIKILENTKYIINEETGEEIKTFRHEVAFLYLSYSLMILSAILPLIVILTYLFGLGGNKFWSVLGYFLRILYLFAMLILCLLNLTHSIPWVVKTTGYKGEFDNRSHFGVPVVLIAIALILTTIGYSYPLLDSN